eukprot:2778182-Alexandrium_andersonii.AAC.1
MAQVCRCPCLPAHAWESRASTAPSCRQGGFARDPGLTRPPAAAREVRAQISPGRGGASASAAQA